MNLATLLTLLEDDRELIEQLFELEILPRSEDFPPDLCDRARVARTLVRELDVNWPGVEIILRMRGEILDMHRQLAELFTVLKAGRTGTNGP